METDNTTPTQPTVDEDEPAADPQRGIHQIRLRDRCILYPAALLVKLWGRTLRFDHDCAIQKEVIAQEQAILGVLWHNRLFFAGEVFRRYRPGRRLAALVSASRDGAWLDAFFRFMGMQTVRGSSSWRGTQAIRELIRASRAGIDIGITPDGPRGPRYQCKPGAAVVGCVIKKPVYLLGIECRHAIRLRSWDQFMIPLPFAKVTLKFERMLEPIDWKKVPPDPESLACRMERRLLEINRD